MPQAAPPAAVPRRWSPRAAAANAEIAVDADWPAAGPAPSPEAARWRVRVLGGFALDDGQQRLTRLRSRASMALLARLAMAPGRDHGREEVATLLWPDASPAQSRSRLRQTLSLLKAVLEPPGAAPVLVADRRVLRATPGAFWCDALAFEHALGRGDLAAARSLYRGELLPGLYDEWVEDERRRLAAAADRLATPAARAAESIGPWPRPALRAVAPATSAPLPLPPVDRPPGPAPLPAPLTSAFGLDAPAADVGARLATERWITLCGPGGIGKTRLALAVAQAARRRAPIGAGFGDRLLFVDASGGLGAAGLLRRLAAALRLPPGPLTVARTAAAIGSAPVLLLLDGADALDAPARRVLPRLLARLPTLRLLATARGPLGEAGERVLPVHALPVPAEDAAGADGMDDAALAALARQPAVALYVDRARAQRPDFHLHRGNAAALAALVRFLEGHPLAVEFAAGQVRHAPPAAMLALLRDARADAVDGGPPAAALLSRRVARAVEVGAAAVSMSAVMADDLRTLPAPARALLRRLATQDREGLLSDVLAKGAGDAAGTLAALDLLVARGLLQAVDGTDGEPRFGMSAMRREWLRAQPRHDTVPAAD